MSKWIIGTEDFNKNLDNWLLKNDQKYANWLLKNKEKIPPTFRNCTETLYRGMMVDSEFLNLLKENKLIFTNCTSWTKDVKIAKKFANDPDFKKSNKIKGTKIIISKKIPSNMQILDIDSFILFMGIDQLEMMGLDETNLDSAVKEKEVLIASKLKIAEKDVKFFD